MTARLALPPGFLILLALIGLVAVRARLRFGAPLAAFSVLSLYALSMPVVSGFLVRSLEPPYMDPAKDTAAGAIVILGGGTSPASPEYGADRASSATLERLRYGVHLQRRTGKPILVTGGNPAEYAVSEAEVMSTTLSEFGATARWIEGGSHNTYESARLTAQMLKNAGVHGVYLVTHAWHMPRARMSFERAGLHVVAAPTAYLAPARIRVLDFLPSGHALHYSYVFFHEVLGIFWYRLRFDLGR